MVIESGTTRNPKGRGQEGVGRAASGQLKQAAGGVQDLYVEAMDGAGEAIEAVRRMPGSVEDSIREYILARPFSTAAIALGLGWLLGRSHRPF
jgi:hypothetical protein